MSKIRLSVDDGASSDVRVAELATRYGIETIFYIPVEWQGLNISSGRVPLTYNQAQELADNFSIGSHGITHRHLTSIPFKEAVIEIIDSKKMLENLFNVDVTKFCPSRGYLNDELIEVVNQTYESYRLTRQKGLVHIHPNSGANNNRPWRDCIDKETKELFCHSWELDKYNLWKELEDYLESISTKV